MGASSRGPRGRYETKWDRVPELGKMPDVEVAKLYGCSSLSVTKARIRRGIPVFRRGAKYPLRACAPVTEATWNAVMDVFEGENFGCRTFADAVRACLDEGAKKLLGRVNREDEGSSD